MNVFFHYCAVKGIAILAGMEEADAQLVAEYSQFVDDFAYSGSITSLTPPPQDLIANGIASKNKVFEGWDVNCVTTGFATRFEHMKLAFESNQNAYLIPFHFPTPDKLQNKNDMTPTRPAYFNSPTPADDQIISSLLRGAIASYQENRNPENLIRIGVILHPFADTYAHQGFSGHSTENNKRSNTQVFEKTVSGVSDKTKIYQKGESHLLAVGHCYAGHSPDDTNVSFTLTDTYGRNNFDEFLKAAEEIYQALLSINPGARPPDYFQRVATPLLQRLFLCKNEVAMQASAFTEWLRTWNTVRQQFPEEAPMIRGFDYSRDRILGRMGLTKLLDSDGKERTLTSDEITAAMNLHALDEGHELVGAKYTVGEEFWAFTSAAYGVRIAIGHV